VEATFDNDGLVIITKREHLKTVEPPVHNNSRLLVETIDQELEFHYG